ncbi:MAG: DoxX family protein [Bacteroidales bacterium]|nr:DoxX family protein [Bacteroidales bacterium]
MISIRNLSRFIAGFVFIFSGLVKGIDPMGSMIKFIDYFTAFHLDALEPLAYILGIILCTAEFIIGFAILTGIRMKIASWGLLIFMAAFTPLTLYLAIANPVDDCGCFGDAIHLTNWQTFYKNIIISLFVIIVFINRNRYRTLSLPLNEWLILLLVAAAFILFTQYNRRHLPIVDFRPYSTGTDIPASIAIPEGAPVDQYETTLIYEKDGSQKEFTLENYPSGDSSWVFVDSKTKLIKRGYTPPIHDFSLITPDGQDLTDIIMGEEGFSLLMLSAKFSEADPDLIASGIEAGLECQDHGMGFYVLGSSVPDFIENSTNFNMLLVDETTLKTIIRSNPGFMSIREGVITAKWAGRDLPGKDEIAGVIENSYPVREQNGTLILILLLSGIIFISFMINFILIKRA